MYRWMVGMAFVIPTQGARTVPMRIPCIDALLRAEQAQLVRFGAALAAPGLVLAGARCKGSWLMEIEPARRADRGCSGLVRPLLMASG